MTRRAAPDPGIRISMSALRIGLAVVVGILTLAAIVGLATVVRANEPVAVASAAQMRIQQAAIERDIERSYEQAVEQVRKVRALNLAITAAQADQIAAKAFADLHTLRHSAFQSLGQSMDMATTEADGYATQADARFDQAPVSKETASPSPVLLAPRFYAFASRMSELSTLIADQATTALTAPPPSASPTAVPSASPTPTPRPSTTPSPTPTR